MGMQGAGKPASFAAITIGLVGALQNTKGTIFIKGTKSMTLGAGRLHTITLFVGSAMRGVGAVPKEHFTSPPVQTH